MAQDWTERVFSEGASALQSIAGAEVIRAIPLFRIEMGTPADLNGLELVLSDGRVIAITAEGDEEGFGSLQVENRGEVRLHDCDCPATNSPPDPCLCRGSDSSMGGGREPIFDYPEGRRHP